MKEATVNFNPFLKPWVAPQPNNVAGKGQIEIPGQVENQVWQNRKAAPTQYENDLGDALERVFESGATELDDVVAGLNRIGFRAPDGTGPIISWGGPPVAPKTRKNRLHLDIAPPAGADQQAEVERLTALGAARVDIGQGDVSWVVMADPDGNEFCVLTPRQMGA